MANYFGYKKVELCLNDKFTKYIKSNYSDFPKLLSKNKFGYVFYEFETDFIFLCGLGEYSEFEFKNFEYYISQLPNLTVENTCFLLSLIDLNYKRIENPFTFNNIQLCKYSNFLLIETFGKIIYKTQLKELILNSNISDLSIIYDSSSCILELIDGYNNKEEKVLNIFKRLFIPSNLSLFELLKYNTPLHKRNSIIQDFGFLTHNHKSKAFEFVMRANKYFTSSMEFLKWTPQKENIWNHSKYEEMKLNFKMGDIK